MSDLRKIIHIDMDALCLRGATRFSGIARQSHCRGWGERREGWPPQPVTRPAIWGKECHARLAWPSSNLARELIFVKPALRCTAKYPDKSDPSFWIHRSRRTHGLDEAYLDVTVNKNMAIATDICKRKIRQKIMMCPTDRFSRVSYNKFLAKWFRCAKSPMASQWSNLYLCCPAVSKNTIEKFWCG